MTTAWRAPAPFVVGVLALGGTGPLSAHPIHSTLTEIVVTADGRASVRIRAFADDFSAAVSRFTGVKQHADFSVPDADAQRYLLASFRLATPDGKPIRFSIAGQRRQGDVVWLELLAAAPGSLSGARIVNALLFDIHADQVNVVKAVYGTVRHTSIFSNGEGEKRLP